VVAHQRGHLLEYLIQYGMFLAKVATLVVTLVLVIGAIVSAGSRQRRSNKRGEIVVVRLNEHLEDLHDAVRDEVIDSATLKLENKARAKREKEEAKAEKKRAVAEAKEKAKAKTQSATVKSSTAIAEEDVTLAGENEGRNEKPTRRKRVYVLDFDGDVAAEEVSSLREEITTVLSIAETCDEIILKLESPGGMVHAYGLAASQLQRIKDAKIPLTICVDKVAASGGYMMACLADKLIAAPFAIIGSIGVVVQLPNFHKVL
jgi:serine protease SohB